MTQAASPEHQALIDNVAAQCGLGEAYYDHRGEFRRFSAAARNAILRAMGLPIDDEPALQSILSSLTSKSRSDASDVTGQCFAPPIHAGKKIWGLSVQLYTLRSHRNWGIGDFEDLRQLIRCAAPLGCGLIGLNPLHALFPAAPGHCSPYSPSNRSLLNVLYIAVDALPEYASDAELKSLVSAPAFQAALAAVRLMPNVAYEQVAALKMPALRMAFAHFEQHDLRLQSMRARDFERFKQAGGDGLRNHAIFDALDAHFRLHAPPVEGWQQWPAEFREPSSPAVAQFAQDNQDEVDFHIYLQWVARTQLADAQRTARELGMPIGLYGDLAVGANPDGSEVWSNQALYVAGASIGAPPDPLALNGQDWGIPPINPHVLLTQACEPFAALLRANMRDVGALRIDHVMSLFRLWWVPRGFSAVEGVYVHYPLADLLKKLVVESQQAQCVVIGEDLGTVPDEMRHAMAHQQLLHYKVLLFEKRYDGAYKLPHEYESRAIATATTHDLPPLKAWWQMTDIELREQLGLYPHPETAHQLRNERQNDRRAVMQALTEAGLWHWQAHEAIPDYSLPLLRAVHCFLGYSQAALVLVQLEDLMEMTDPVNVPGTHTEHANWQRKLICSAEELFASVDVCESLQALSRVRSGERPNM